MQFSQSTAAALTSPTAPCRRPLADLPLASHKAAASHLSLSNCRNTPSLLSSTLLLSFAAAFSLFLLAAATDSLLPHCCPLSSLLPPCISSLHQQQPANHLTLLPSLLLPSTTLLSATARKPCRTAAPLLLAAHPTAAAPQLCSTSHRAAPSSSDGVQPNLKP